MTVDANDIESQPEDAAAVDSELAALGETPAGDEEIRFHRAGAEPRADIDVETVATMVAIGYTDPDSRPLSQIEDRRTWNRIADRLESSGFALTRVVGSRSVWRSVVAGLAMAAGVALVPRIVPDGPAANISNAPTRAESEAIGQAARRGLEALGEEDDTKRAQDVVSAYSARLQEENERR